MNRNLEELPMSVTERKSPDAAVPLAPLTSGALNTPNLITISRLVLAVILFWLIDYDGYWLTAAVVFLAAAATDFLDGYIARKYGLVTTLGRIMDPFADKIIICGAFVFLLGQPSSGVTAWMVIIIIGREMFVTSLRGFLEQHGMDFSATMSGKLKMVLQCAAVVASLLSLSAEFREFVPTWRIDIIRDVLLYSAIAITVYSGGIYVHRAAVMIRAQSANSPPT
jgi:CDP-diacylglycerol---glycerol-3-phosphate 3-phosphatidyltransferase